MCHSCQQAILQTSLQLCKLYCISIFLFLFSVFQKQVGMLCILSQGYDFGFMRRSRLFEECSDHTSFKWQSQYVGGNKLAVCNSKAQDN